MTISSFSRRRFLKVLSLGMGFPIITQLQKFKPLEDFPQGEKLGRAFNMIEIKQRPDINAPTVEIIYDDSVIPWLREVVGYHPYRFRQTFVETPKGYIWSSDLQPVKNIPNVPVNSLPSTTLGNGMWAEVTIPWVDIVLENKPISPGYKSRLAAGLPLRLYYSQILWIDQIKVDEQGEVWYRINERWGYGDIFWAPAAAFRALQAAEVEPINPDVGDKSVLINVEERYQTMSCFEGNNEVYFCRISAGKKFKPDGTPLGHSATPTGTLSIWRKQISTHMSGGTSGAGYDLPGIGWTTLFSGDGVAVHSTFWHNNFGGELMSHGCINAKPEDSKWVFRWTNPPVMYDPGDLYSKDIDVPPTKITVVEG